MSGMPTLVAQPAPARAWPKTIGSLYTRIRLRVIGDWPVYAIIGLHLVAAVLLVSATGHANAFAYLPYFMTWPIVFFGLFPFIYGLLGLLAVVHRLDRRRGLAFRLILTPERLAQFASGLAVLAALMVFHGSFTTLKNALPLWQGGFPFDRAQADIDNWLHLGADPWVWLYGIGQHSWIRTAVQYNYNQGWFIVCYAALFFVCVSPAAAAIRMRYIMTYVVVWIVVGNVLAGLFLSAGPAFYGFVTGDAARFSEQLRFLAEAADGMHSSSLIQSYLWDLYSSGASGFGSGVSAFPSMHVALVTLNTLFLFEWRVRAGMAGVAYTLFIVASSVYLAWHYAIDGYAAVLVTMAIYFALRALMPVQRGPTAA